MSLEMIRQNARSIIEAMDGYDKLVKLQLYMLEKHDSSQKLNEINEKILQLKTYFLKLVTNIETLVKQEQNLLGKPFDKSLGGKEKASPKISKV